MRIKDIKYFFIFLTIYLLSCKAPNDGCLDSTASNFDVEADIDCCDIESECCCTYPDLKLDLSYKLTATDTLSDALTNFKIGTLYPLVNSADSIMIDTFELFVSGFKPINLSLSDTIFVLETIDYSQVDADEETIALSVEDNIALINGTQFTYDLGTYSSDIEIDQINYSLGLSTILSQIDPDEITNDNNLRNSYNYLFNELTASFPSMRLKMTLKGADKERVITRELHFEEPIFTSFLTPVLIEKGEDLTIPLRINVLDVFKGIIFDVENEDIDLIIRENLTSSIIIIE